MSSLRLTQVFHCQAALVAQVSVVSLHRCFFKERGVMQRARAKHQQAAIRVQRGGRRVALRGQRRASVWADSISAWHRAGRRAPAAPGKGGQVLLAELPLFSSASSRQEHFTLVLLLSGEDRDASILLNFTTSVSCHVFSWNINFLFIIHRLPTNFPVSLRCLV